MNSNTVSVRKLSDGTEKPTQQINSASPLSCSNHPGWLSLSRVTRDQTFSESASLRLILWLYSPCLHYLVLRWLHPLKGPLLFTPVTWKRLVSWWRADLVGITMASSHAVFGWANEVSCLLTKPKDANSSRKSLFGDQLICLQIQGRWNVSETKHRFLLQTIS